MALKCGLVEVRKLRARSWQLGKVSVHRHRSHAAEYGTHGRDSKVDGVMLLFRFVKVAMGQYHARAMSQPRADREINVPSGERGHGHNPDISMTSLLNMKV